MVPAAVHRDDVAWADVDGLTFDFELGPAVLNGVDLVRAVRVLGILAAAGSRYMPIEKPGRRRNSR